MDRYRAANKERLRDQQRVYQRAHPEGYRAQNKKYREANPEKTRALTRAWNDLNRDRIQANNKAYYVAHMDQCKANARAFYAANLEQCKETMQKWVENNRDQHNLNGRIAKQRRRAAGDLSKDDWLEVLAEFGNACLACGATERIEMDHIVPIIKGGLNLKDNLQPLCKSCNTRKTTKIIDYRYTQILFELVA